MSTIKSRGVWSDRDYLSHGEKPEFWDALKSRELWCMVIQSTHYHAVDEIAHPHKKQTGAEAWFLSGSAMIIICDALGLDWRYMRENARKNFQKVRRARCEGKIKTTTKVGEIYKEILGLRPLSDSDVLG